MSAKASVKDVLLWDQSTWDGWYENIKGSVPDYLWKYFDLDNAAIFVDPIPPVEPVIKPPPQPAPTLGPTTRNTQPPGKTPEHRAGRESRYKENMDMYFKRHTIYRDDLAQESQSIVGTTGSNYQTIYFSGVSPSHEYWTYRMANVAVCTRLIVVAPLPPEVAEMTFAIITT
ncbi:hypothetical protein MMC31_001244 [Peltigera leucophlebia]|nr:hypothetical protein [Peltigera leucophlebia]